ncbi:MAG: putative hydro-lyase [Rhodobacteraceae bacterium]|nr:putative hydro-lyase [Paracoccaceae bacterium]
MTPLAARRLIRAGTHARPTAGLAPGALQANLVILPEAEAQDFEAFCAANPKPCPLLARTGPGDPFLLQLGEDIDLRYDLPGYHIWYDGQMSGEQFDIAALWRDDLVSFALGCSYGFEAALQEAGIALRHIDAGHNVSMYDTSLPVTPAGRFFGNMVVSMRPIPAERLGDVHRICAEFPLCHGPPVHTGPAEEIGIADLAQVNYGDPTEVAVGESPVFWACGVTPQNAIRTSKPGFAITHAPGKMLICDLPAGVATISA